MILFIREVIFENNIDITIIKDCNINLDSNITSLINKFNIDILNLFSCSNNESLINKLKDLDYEAGSVCARKMKSIGGWTCTDCEKNSNSILCQQCWSKVKDKHISHEIKYTIKTNGTCDCGDLNNIEISLFCPKHKGPLTKEDDIQNYINKFFSKELIQTFEEIIENFIKQILPYIIYNIENKKNNSKFNKNMKHFLDLINILIYNSALMHILSKKFLKNYKYKTKHFCLLMNNNEITLIKNSEEHECVCPLIRILMSSWCNNNKDILYRFLLNYKLRKTMGIFYFLLNERFMKYLISDFGELSVQYIFDDVCTSVANSSGLMEFYYDSISQIIGYFTNNISIYDEEENCPLYQKIKSFRNDNTKGNINIVQKFSNLKSIILRIYYDTIYLIKPGSSKYLGNNINIYKKLINILSIFHNINHIISYYPHKIGFYKDSFDSNIINAEYYLLFIFELYTSIFNFDNENMTKNIFEYFSDIIINKKFKQLNDNEYSFHSTLYRGFSIFLNKYSFFYINSINSNDIIDGYKNSIKYIPKIHQLREIIINDIFKLFGYINACGENFLKYYGELMPSNEIFYCEQEEFILRDFSLLRFFLSSKIFQSSFSILNIFKKCSLENTYNIMEKLFFSNDNIPPEKNFLEIEDNYKFMKFNSKIIKLILNMIRDNKSLLWELDCPYQIFKNIKMPNKLIKSIIMNDKKNIKEICKKLIINEIISKENLDTFSNIMNIIFSSIKDIFGEEEIEEIILSMSNKTLTINKKAKFSIKDEYLKYLDISSIYDLRQKSNIQKYINNFKKEQISIYNTYFYPFTKYEENSQKNIYQNFFLNQENFNIIFKITELLFENENYYIFHQIMLSEIINYWNIFFYSIEENNNNQDYKSFIIQNKIKIEKLIILLSNNSLNDNSIKNYCSSIVERIIKNENFINLKVKNEDNNKINDKNITINKCSMKEKLKRKYKNNLSQLEKIYNTDSIKTESKIYEPCIYCLKPIETNNIINFYGKVGNLIKDLLYSNSLYQTIKNKYFSNKGELDQIFPSFEKTKSFSIYSCNHYIHYSCFLKLKQNSNNEKCPLCHQNVNLFIPCLTEYNDKETYYIFKGFNLSEKTKNDLLIEDLIDNNKFTILISEEEKINIKKFKELMDINDIKTNELIQFLKVYLFIFIQDIDINKNDINNKNIITEKLIDKCSEAFGNFFDFIENYDNKKNLLEHWKNITLLIRLLMKLEELDYYTAYNKLNYLFRKLCTFDEINFCEMIFEDSLKKILFQILFLICILFDYKIFNGYERYIIKLFLPLYTIQYYIRQILINNNLKFDLNILQNNFNNSQFNKYLKTDENISNVLLYISRNIMLTNILINNNIQNCHEKISFERNKILDIIGLSSFKSESYDEILLMQESPDQKDEILINSFFNQYLPKIKIDFFSEKYINSINNYYNNNKLNYISIKLLGSCLPLEYKFINLQKLAIDFQYYFFDIQCNYCKKIGVPSYVCLTCGKKICNTYEVDCKVKKPIIEHNEECGGGRSIFINTSNYKATLVYKSIIYQMDIPFYANKFGECIDNNITGKDIKLNEEEIKKAIKIFINYSWTNYVLNN